MAALWVLTEFLNNWSSQLKISWIIGYLFYRKTVVNRAPAIRRLHVLSKEKLSFIILSWITQSTDLDPINPPSSLDPYFTLVPPSDAMPRRQKSDPTSAPIELRVSVALKSRDLGDRCAIVNDPNQGALSRKLLKIETQTSCLLLEKHFSRLA